MPTNSELRKFVTTEGWQDKDKKSGKKKGDHHRYILELLDGTVLYTRVSHGSGGIDDPSLFASILRTQLAVTEDQFWACVNRGILPPRPGEAIATPVNAVNAGLARNLIKKVGLRPEDLEGLNQQRAIEIWNQFLTGESWPFV